MFTVGPLLDSGFRERWSEKYVLAQNGGRGYGQGSSVKGRLEPPGT